MKPWEKHQAKPWEKFQKPETVEPEAPSGFAMGAGDPLYGASQLLSESVPENVRSGLNELNNWLASKGLPLQTLGEGGVTQQVQEREQAYQQAREAAGEEGFDWSRLGGNVATGLIPGGAAAKLAAGGKALGGAVGGAGFAATMPVTEGDFWEEKAKQTALGGATGAAVPAGVSGLARAISPKTAPAVKQMITAGVPVTPGQIMGGTAKRAEEAARSLPIMGDVITAAHRRGIEGFNKAAINKVLAPIGKQTDEIGYKGVEKAQQAISKAYDDLLPTMKIKTDPAYTNEISTIKQMASNMHPDRVRQFDSIIENQVTRKFTPQGTMHPKTMKEVESQLGKLSSRYRKSTDGDQQLLGEAIGEVQASLRNMIARGNPQKAGELTKINEAYANLLRVENASARQGAKGGVFTPNQLEAATRSLDPTLRKRGSAHGKALMQDFAGAGEEAITQKLPTSGTAERLMFAGGGLGAGLINPAIPAALIGGAGAYTAPAQKIAQTLLAGRPKGAEAVSEAVRKLAPYLTPGAVAVGEGITSQRY
jgi:hypothetical protein